MNNIYFLKKTKIWWNCRC